MGACRFFLALLCAIGGIGCTPGFLYTDITLPLTTNVEKTPRGERYAELSATGIRLPLPRARISAEWGKDALGEAAQAAGLSQIDYVDIRTISVLGGTWRRSTVQIWGR